MTCRSWGYCVFWGLVWGAVGIFRGFRAFGRAKRTFARLGGLGRKTKEAGKKSARARGGGSGRPRLLRLLTQRRLESPRPQHVLPQPIDGETFVAGVIAAAAVGGGRLTPPPSPCSSSSSSPGGGASSSPGCAAAALVGGEHVVGHDAVPLRVPAVVQQQQQVEARQQRTRDGDLRPPHTRIRVLRIEGRGLRGREERVY